MEDAAINILLVGSGGREHALAWKLSRSPRLGKLYAAPGNAGIAQLAELVTLDIADHDAVIAFARANGVALVVVGPEQPLVDGLVDALDAAGVRAFGPSAAAARLEGSKGFTKDLCVRAGIPTAAYRRFTDLAEAKAALPGFGLPVVIKADGLAAGKGVVIAATVAEATTALADMLGGAGAEVVIEAFMTGEEASLFAITDGEFVLPFGSAQDHKRVGDGDVGPNTGGMGAYSPARVLTPELEARALAEIVGPTVRAMAAAGTPYRGVLYAGLMLTDAGPQLIEYNCRFGDPECQVLMLRLESDLVDILLAACDGRLREARPRWSADPALTVVMAANGYPAAVEKGSVIGGVAQAEQTGAAVFHAGTARNAAGELIATGGRVLNVSATGASVGAAQQAAYRAVDAIDWPGGFCRRDIGWREAEREALEGGGNAG